MERSNVETEQKVVIIIGRVRGEGDCEDGETYMSAFKDGKLAAAEEDVAPRSLGVGLCGWLMSHVLGG